MKGKFQVRNKREVGNCGSKMVSIQNVKIVNLNIFDGKNFADWSFRMKLKLEKNEVLSVLTATEEDMKKPDFVKNDVKAREILVQSISDKILNTVRTKYTAKGMMDALETTYAKKGLAAQIELKRNLMTLKHTQGKLDKFFEIFFGKVDELRLAGATLEDSEIVSLLLMAMPDSYRHVTSSIDILYSNNPKNISIEFVKSKLLQEEVSQNVRQESSGNSAGDSAFFTRSRGNGRSQRGSNRNRNDSKRNQNNSNKNQSNGGNGNEASSYFPYRCHFCGKRGHKKSQCPDKERDKTSYLCTEEKESEEITFMTASEQFPEECDAIFLSESQEIPFIVDSGATNHLVSEKVGNYLVDLEHVNFNLIVAKKNHSITASKRGTLYARSGTRNLTIKDVLICNDLNYNLLSVTKMENAGCQVIFGDGKVKFLKNGTTFLEGEKQGNLYIVRVSFRGSVNVSVNSEITHRRMGHSSHYSRGNCVCEVCAKSKMTRTDFKLTATEKKPRSVLEIVSSDVAGPISPETYDGFKYYVSFTDHFSRFSVVYLIKTKGEVFEKFLEYEAKMTAQCKSKISHFRSDNGGEYSSNEIKKFCRQKGIQLDYTVARNPEQNGVSERLNQTVMNMARCLLNDAHLDKSFWGEAVRTAVYTINRLPSSAIDGKMPAELFYGRKVDIGNMRVFGSLAYSHIPKEDRRGKLADRSKPTVMVGYVANGYRLWDPAKRKIITSRSVRFDETKLGIKETKTEDWKVTIDTSTPDDEIMQQNDDEIAEDNEGESLRRSDRVRRPPKKLDDYETGLMAALSTGYLPSELPSSYKAAIKANDGWDAAIDAELLNHEKNSTWKLIPRSSVPQDETIIDSKWVFTKKLINGKEIKKARLVARGFLQDAQQGEEVYAPVARMVTLRVLLAIAVEKNYKIHQLDVKSAFLHGCLETPVYMKVPQGLACSTPNLVCELQKALYGLRSASKEWYKCFHIFLLSIGFKRSKVDPCVYYNGSVYLLVWVDDILLFAVLEAEIVNVKNHLAKRFELKDLTNVNVINFLGLEIECKGNFITVSQKRLIQKVLKNFHMENSHPKDVPISKGLKLEVTRDPENDRLPYRELVGSLMYIMMGTRPDLCFAISYFSQFQSCYSEEHWKYLKDVLRYLNAVQNLGLKFSKNTDCNLTFNLQAYADADFANSKDRKSISGFVVKLNTNLIAWKSKKQNSVTLSSAEAEYVAISVCLTECLFIKQFIEDILSKDFGKIMLFEKKIVVFEDNQSAIKIANTLETKQSKHIDIRYHFTRELIANNVVELIYIPTDRQIADMMTKPLPPVTFKKFTFLLGLEIV